MSLLRWYFYFCGTCNTDFVAGVEACIPSSSVTISIPNTRFKGHGISDLNKILPPTCTHLSSPSDIVANVIREVMHFLYIKKVWQTLFFFQWSLAKSISNHLCRTTFPWSLLSDVTIAVSPNNKATLSGFLFSSSSTLDYIPSPREAPFTNPIPLAIITFRTIQTALLSDKCKWIKRLEVYCRPDSRTLKRYSQPLYTVSLV